MDYYLHLMQHGLRNDKEADHRMKDILSALTLHLCSRPQDEVVAWTINVRHPLMNLFATGGSRPTGRITGRVFVDDVKDSGKNLFIAQVNRGLEVGRQSMVDFEGMDILEAVEHFYADVGGCLAAISHGPIGLHRFYLFGFSDGLGWIWSIPSALGWYGVQRVQQYKFLIRNHRRDMWVTDMSDLCEAQGPKAPPSTPPSVGDAKARPKTRALFSHLHDAIRPRRPRRIEAGCCRNQSSADRS
jgi:hypothetical protein